MVSQITNNIKISVLTDFEGVFIKNHQYFYAFKYQITIENNSPNTVQLISRHWDIFDSLNLIQIVDGEGVIGKKKTTARRKTHLRIRLYINLNNWRYEWLFQFHKPQFNSKF